MTIAERIQYEQPGVYQRLLRKDRLTSAFIWLERALDPVVEAMRGLMG